MLVGVVNVTPDSFSDGGLYLDSHDAIMAGLELSVQGAWMVDVGGESTRPGASEVSIADECERVVPVVKGLADSGVSVSIDTHKPEVAARAIEAGADAINDVTGFTNPEMIDLCAATGVGAIVMHMKGDPRTMQANPTYRDVVSEVGSFLLDRAQALEAAGVAPHSIVIDPGFGFGKTLEHNLELMNRLDEICALGYPVMLGTSRKSTLGEVSGQSDPMSRDVATAATTALGFERGARLFRVHNVVASRDALRIAAAIVDPQRWDEWQQD
ncbi:MAG TPA: dihydropteroate synthase [Acidimicrobiia bacterium]